MSIGNRRALRLTFAPGDGNRLMLCYPPDAMSREDAQRYLDSIVELLRELADEVVTTG